MEKLMKRYALTRQGAKDFIICTIVTTIQNIMLMAPVAILYYITSDLISGSISKSNNVAYIIACVIMLVVMGIVFYFQYNTSFFSTYIESEHRRINLAEKLRELPLSFFEKKDLSDLTSTILGDCTVLEHNFSHVMPQFFGSIISTIIIAVSLFFFNCKLAVAALWVLPIALIIVGCSGKVQRGISRRKRKVVLAQEEGFQEYLETVKDLKSYNAEDTYVESLKEKMDNLEKESFRAELGTSVFVISASCILRLGIGTVALVGASLLVKGQIDIMIFFMFILVVSRIYEPMQGTLMNLAAIISQDVNVERMNEITNYPVQSGDGSLDVNSYDLEFDKVAFSYVKGENVLTDVSFTAKQGEVTALIGPSGGGKSTVSKLAARFYDADKGKICLDDVDIRDMKLSQVRESISQVMQDVFLFSDTIAENIKLGKKDYISEEEVEIASNNAQVSEFATKMKNKYNTVIGERGVGLSGGQKQRISIARAFAKKNPILILDDSTSALDMETEQQIQEALRKLDGVTKVIIAHRISAVKNADEIIILKDGIIAERGKHQQLLEKHGLYYETYQSQYGDVEGGEVNGL